jgi:diphosphomevalonate decarboxylase
MKKVTVSAAANVALVKYWGKQERGRNQPATASLSIGLEDLRTETTLSYTDAPDDQIEATLHDAAKLRIVEFLDSARSRFEVKQHFLVQTANNFPTGSGLASSASGFAALSIAFDSLMHLKLSRENLSRLALSGSGSASRSVHGGYVEVIPADDAYAISIMKAEAWPLDVIVAVTADAEKAIGSSEAMKLTASSSPFYPAWLSSHDSDMHLAREAVSGRDFEKLAAVSEHNCLKMHAAIMTSQPPVLYWLPATMAVMHEVVRLRSEGTPAFFTIDAGPQVKVVCDPSVTPQVDSALSQVDGVLRTIRTRVGGEPLIKA